MLLGVVFADEASRGRLQDLVEAKTDLKPSMPAHLTLMFSDLAIRHVERGRTDRIDRL